VAREELERARRELRITERRLRGWRRRWVPDSHQRRRGGGAGLVASSQRKGDVGTTSEGRTCARHVSVQTPDVGSSSQPSISDISALEKSTHTTAGELASTVKNGQGSTGRAGLVASCTRMEDEGGGRKEGREQRAIRRASPQEWERARTGAPRVLRRAGQDLAQIDAHLATVHRCHSRALKAIGQARSWWRRLSSRLSLSSGLQMLIPLFIQSQEKQLVAASARISPIPSAPIIVWSSDAHLDPPSESIGATTSPPGPPTYTGCSRAK